MTEDEKKLNVQLVLLCIADLLDNDNSIYYWDLCTCERCHMLQVHMTEYEMCILLKLIVNLVALWCVHTI